MDSSFDADIMLLLQNKALVYKFFYKNDDQNTLENFVLQKGWRRKKDPFPYQGYLNLTSVSKKRVVWKIVSEVVGLPWENGLLQL